jgi:hypothetical protein
VYGPPLAAAALLVAAWQPTAATVGVGVALAAAALHSLADVLGGGLELRPWEATSERAVYDHHRSRWLAPRRWVRYDGSPRDLLLAVALAAPLLVTLDAPLRVLVFATLAVAVGYTAVRRVLPGLAVFVVDRLLAPVAPGRAFAYVPARYRERTGGDAPADGSS